MLGRAAFSGRGVGGGQAPVVKEEPVATPPSRWLRPTQVLHHVGPAACLCTRSLLSCLVSWMSKQLFGARTAWAWLAAFVFCDVPHHVPHSVMDSYKPVCAVNYGGKNRGHVCSLLGWGHHLNFPSPRSFRNLRSIKLKYRKRGCWGNKDAFSKSKEKIIVCK